MNEFKNHHPIVLISYFILVIFFIMFSMHPVVIALSLLSSITINFVIKTKDFRKSLKWYFFMYLLIVISNPFLSPQGNTVMFTVFTTKVTYEALIYGIIISSLLISIFSWFNFYNEIMTSDKFTYLFGKIIPTIGLIISMGLKMIPLFKEKLSSIENAQKGMGITDVNLKQKYQASFRKYTALITYSLESSLETSDAMKARGYGVRKRTSFTIYKFSKSDYRLIALITILGGYIIWCFVNKDLAFGYYPIINKINLSLVDIINYATVSLFFFLPVIVEIKEEIRWRFLKSKI